VVHFEVDKALVAERAVSTPGIVNVLDEAIKERTSELLRSEHRSRLIEIATLSNRDANRGTFA